MLKLPLQFWCLFLLVESIRQTWIVVFIGPPDSVSYGVVWEKTEALSISALLLSTTEVFFRSSSFYAGTKKVFAYIFGLVVLIGATVEIAICFRPQMGIQWSNLPLRNMVLSHQIAYGSISVSMLLILVGFGLAPNNSTQGYRKHARLLAIFAGFDSSVVLLSNLRLIPAPIVGPLLGIGTIAILSLWFFIKKDDFRTTQAPHDPDRRNRLMRALQTLKDLRDPFRGPRSRPPSRETLVQH